MSGKFWAIVILLSPVIWMIGWVAAKYMAMNQQLWFY